MQLTISCAPEKSLAAKSNVISFLKLEHSMFGVAPPLEQG